MHFNWTCPVFSYQSLLSAYFNSIASPWFIKAKHWYLLKVIDFFSLPVSYSIIHTIRLKKKKKKTRCLNTTLCVVQWHAFHFFCEICMNWVPQEKQNPVLFSIPEGVCVVDTDDVVFIHQSVHMWRSLLSAQTQRPLKKQTKKNKRSNKWYRSVRLDRFSTRSQKVKHQTSYTTLSNRSHLEFLWSGRRNAKRNENYNYILKCYVDILLIKRK